MPAPRIVLTDHSDSYPPETLAYLVGEGMEVVDADRDPGGPVAAMREADALLVNHYPVTTEVIRRLARCRVIVRIGVGFDNVDIEAAAARGIAVCNVPDYCPGEVADHAMALALSLARGLPFLERWTRGGGWRPAPLPYPVRGFETLTFGILGLGRIGSKTAARARGFRFRLAGCDPYVPDAIFAELGVERLDLDGLLAQSDILSLHVPLTSETSGLLTAERLARMKPAAILVNTSRGSIVDTVALAHTLEQGALSAAGVDVFEEEPLPSDHPLLRAPNTILTPHYAWYSRESWPRLYRMAAEEAVRGVRGEPLRNRVA